MRRLVIGTRGSPLATWQADHVRRLLLDRFNDVAVEQRDREYIRRLKELYWPQGLR